MGLLGDLLFGSSSTTKTTSTALTQESADINAGAEVSGLLQGKGASYQTQDLQDSLQISGNNTGEVVFNQFPEAVQNSVKDLVGVVKEAVTQSSQTQLASTQALGTKLQELSLGDTSIIPKIALYGLVALVVIVAGRKFLK